MSRFFRGGDSESSDSTDSEDELYSGSSEEQEKAGEGSEEEPSSSEEESDESDESGDDRKGPSRFLKKGAPFLVGAVDEESDDEGPRLVKSSKDKRMEEIDACVKAIENAEKINDWSAIFGEFDKLNRAVEKAKSLERVPKSYIKCIAELENFMNEALRKEKDAKKKMNATNARALNSIKQRIRKNNRGYEKEIILFREDPEGYMAEDELLEEEAAKPRRDKGEDEVIIDGVVQKGFVAPEGEDEAGFATVGKGGRVVQFTAENILKHLRAVLDARGKKSTDRLEQIKVLEQLNEIADDNYKRIRVLLTLISTRFDLTSGALSSMSLEQYKAAQGEIVSLLSILEKDRSFVVVEDVEDIDDDENVPKPQPGEVIKVRGSIVSFVDRLDDEMTKALQSIDPHTSEYIDRLKHESTLYSVILRCESYFEQNRLSESLNRTIMRRLEHLYFKPDSVILTLEKTSWEMIPTQMNSQITPREGNRNATELIHLLCVQLYKQDASLLRTRAMLCHIYHHALHNRFHQARDMLLMSHLQETIQAADVTTMILYNRTMVQVGLCAFRSGLIAESQTILQEICGMGRQKELLAQGLQMQRYSQISPEQERLERQRQLPFHMHINLELLECTFLTCSMLLEIPAMAQAGGNSSDYRKRAISKPFRRMLDFSERQVFAGPPENTRDHVMQASRALAAGDWRNCVKFIEAIKIWTLMPEADRVKAMLVDQIQEQGLRTYLFTYAAFYNTLSLATLSEMFDLDVGRVKAIVSKMVAHDEIAAALDQVNNAIVFRPGVEMTKLQSLALSLGDKANTLMEANERQLEQKSNPSGQTAGTARRNMPGPAAKSNAANANPRVSA